MRGSISQKNCCERRFVSTGRCPYTSRHHTDKDHPIRTKLPGWRHRGDLEVVRYAIRSNERPQVSALVEK